MISGRLLLVPVLLGAFPVRAADLDQDTTATAWPALRPGTSWQWQIDGGPINETILDSVDNNQKMIDVDMEQTDPLVIARLKAKDIVVICYMETGGWESYRPDAALYPPDILGKPVDGYPKERWVDIRRMDVLGPILEARLNRAKDKGCDGVEPDLDDSYTADTGFPLTKADQLQFNQTLVEAAHRRGLSMGLKNGPDIAEDMADIADWALNESCNGYDECAGYTAFIQRGKAVFQVEFMQPDGMTLEDFCPADNAANFDGLLKRSSATLSALPRQACRFE
jgi:hypothetical protein